jgi:hypothetical protein
VVGSFEHGNKPSYVKKKKVGNLLTSGGTVSFPRMTAQRS